jgi:hypothetical protein
MSEWKVTASHRSRAAVIYVPQRSEPVRTGAPRAPPRDRPGMQTDNRPETGCQHNQ